MPHMILNPIVSSYLNNNGYIQRINGGPLLLSNRRSFQGHSYSNLCITISACDIDFSSTIIHEVALELPIQRIYPNMAYLCNAILLNVRPTSSIGMSQPLPSLRHPITRASFIHNILRLDITSLITQWDFVSFPSLEIIISIECPNLTLQLHNCNHYSTALVIDYEKQRIEPPVPDTTIPIMLSISVKKHGTTIIEANEAIPFDTINDDIANKIHYNTSTFELTFSHTGYYYLEWILNLRGCITSEYIDIGIRNQTTGELHDFHTPCTLPLQLCGQHILPVPDTSENYVLINACDSAIQLSSAHTQASLIIYKI